MTLKVGSLYAKDGVNVLEGDDFSAYSAKVCASTHMNSPFVSVMDLGSDHFRGPRGLRYYDLPSDVLFDFAPDGIGTKSEIITAALSHKQAARDVLAMTAGDITRWGGLPLVFTNVLDVATLRTTGTDTNDCFRSVVDGLVEAANEIGLVLYKGETAELGVCVGSENVGAVTKFNWAGFAQGVYDPTRLINGKSLEPGQRVVALKENGFRSNGISSVRAALKSEFLDNWWSNPNAEEAIKLAATPSVLYDKMLATANGWYDPDFKPLFKMHCIVHITGGGIKSKLGEDILFPLGLSAELTELWYPPQIMMDCAKWRGMPDEELYGVWNGGQGALVVLDEDEVDRFIEFAGSFNISAKDAGKITKLSTPELEIFSEFSCRIVRYSSADAC